MQPIHLWEIEYIDIDGEEVTNIVEATDLLEAVHMVFDDEDLSVIYGVTIRHLANLNDVRR